MLVAMLLRRGAAARSTRAETRRAEGEERWGLDERIDDGTAMGRSSERERTR
jgi:hypothetical protein